MKCENCGKELVFTDAICTDCKKLVRQNVEGFGHTKEIIAKIKEIVNEYGLMVVVDEMKFNALMQDFIPIYDQERGLLMKMLNAGILGVLLGDKNRDMAITKAKGIMLQKLFLSENAAEFVIVCFTYMLGWPYLSPLKQKEAEDLAREKSEAEEKERFRPINIDRQVFSRGDAIKYRLSSNVTIPEGFTKIDSFCFDKFNFMRSIKLPSSMLCIGEFAFSECKHLRGITIPPTLRIIKQGAFSQCVKLTVLGIPDGVLEIESNTFSFCKNLEAVEIPESVGSIGASAFLGCEKLRRLSLPDSIKFIDEDAFAYCPLLTIKCYENSYVHRYCLSHGIKYETVQQGESLVDKKY